MRRVDPNTFDRPFLIICEGESDKKLLDRLISSFVTDVEYQVIFVNGRSNIGSRIKTAYEASESFSVNVKAVLVISDKDEDPEQSFREVQTELRNANFPVPAEEGVVARKKDYPNVVVFMVPIRSPGNIETVCLLSARDQWGFEGPLNNFIEQTPAKDWGIGKLSKAKMQIYLAVTCRKKPDTSFAGHWNLPEEYHLSTRHYCFEEYIRFLQLFPKIAG